MEKNKHNGFKDKERELYKADESDFERAVKLFLED